MNSRARRLVIGVKNVGETALPPKLGGQVFLCRFDSVSELRGKKRTYKNIKEAVLKAGRFSQFDINTSRDANIFTRLCKDPELEVFNLGYPWTGVRKKGDV